MPAFPVNPGHLNQQVLMPPSSPHTWLYHWITASWHWNEPVPTCMERAQCVSNMLLRPWDATFTGSTQCCTATKSSCLPALLQATLMPIYELLAVAHAGCNSLQQLLTISPNPPSRQGSRRTFRCSVSWPERICSGQGWQTTPVQHQNTSGQGQRTLLRQSPYAMPTAGFQRSSFIYA